jgi:hypothetical protein
VVRKILFVEKRRERLHEGMLRDLETGGPVGQVGNWVFIAFFFFLLPEGRDVLWCKQMFPGKEKYLPC